MFDRLVITDAHIGMDVDPYGTALYPGKWDREALMERLQILLSVVIKNKQSRMIYVDDLGDFMDGWNAQTTRKGHELHQNMNNQKAFDVGLEFKLHLARALSFLYDKVIITNVCEDNHSGAFGYVVNAAFKQAAEAMFPGKVKVNNFQRFIQHYIHYTEGDRPNYCFLLTHGKDSENLKFGFKPVLDAPQKEKIDNYLGEYDLMQRNLKIEFSKGDSHLMQFDWTGSARFNYMSYPTFAPSSTWVQHNFKNTKSGFVLWNYIEPNEIRLIPYFFPDRIRLD